MSAGSVAGAERAPVSPDQLDRLLTLIRPRLWIVLGALLVLVGLAVAWGFLADVRETVPSSGILQRGEGPSIVQAPAAGRLTAIEANVDAKVKQGQALASITGSEGKRTVLRAPVDGRLVEVAASSGAVVTVGERLFSVEPAAGALAANVVVPVDRRSEIYVGAPVQVRPNSVGDSELGYAHGTVAAIDPYPAGDAELERVFGNARVVDDVARSQAVYLVAVKLRSDPSGPGGLAWSTPSGSDASIQAGELTDASIVVSEGSVLDQVFP
jgi:multidrug efflux pump subunit AcrA (membrane-fusion protein)